MLEEPDRAIHVTRSHFKVFRFTVVNLSPLPTQSGVVPRGEGWNIYTFQIAIVSAAHHRGGPVSHACLCGLTSDILLRLRPQRKHQVEPFASPQKTSRVPSAARPKLPQASPTSSRVSSLSPGCLFFLVPTLSSPFCDRLIQETHHFNDYVLDRFFGTADNRCLGKSLKHLQVEPEVSCYAYRLRCWVGSALELPQVVLDVRVSMITSSALAD